MSDREEPRRAETPYTPLIAIPDLAEWLAVSSETVKKWVQAGPESKRIPPYIRINGVVRFDPADVQEWIDGKVVR